MTIHHLDIRSSATRHIPNITSEVKAESGYGQQPKIGDVIIGRINKIGHHSLIEEPQGKEASIRTGNICALVLGNRYSTSEFYGELPDKLELNDEFSLLNVGGIAGVVKESNIMADDPTKLTYLGHACGQEGQRLNTFDYTPSPLPPSPSGIPTILVVGTDMDSGKTSACGHIVRILTENGWLVGAGKLTGTSRMKDILYMKACGAKLIADFMDLGYPSTSHCFVKDLEDIWLGLRSLLSQEGCQILVLEVADGVFQVETELILSSQKILSECSVIILAADRSLSAFGAIHYLSNKYYVMPDFLSGLIINSKLSMSELSSKVNIPILSNSPSSQNAFIEMIGKLGNKKSD